MATDAVPSVQNLRLSNYEIRAYDKRSGRLALHTCPYLFLDTEAPFSVHAYLEDMTARLVVPGIETFEFEEISVAEAERYNGRTMVARFWLGALTDWRDVPDTLVQLEASITFNIHGARFRYVGRHDAIIRHIQFTKPRSRRVRNR